MILTTQLAKRINVLILNPQPSPGISKPLNYTQVQFQAVVLILYNKSFIQKLLSAEICHSHYSTCACTYYVTYVRNKLILLTTSDSLQLISKFKYLDEIAVLLRRYHRIRRFYVTDNTRSYIGFETEILLRSATYSILTCKSFGI